MVFREVHDADEPTRLNFAPTGVDELQPLFLPLPRHAARALPRSLCPTRAGLNAAGAMVLRRAQLKAMKCFIARRMMTIGLRRFTA